MLENNKDSITKQKKKIRIVYQVRLYETTSGGDAKLELLL